jgi:hypothetical protein
MASAEQVSSLSASTATSSPTSLANGGGILQQCGAGFHVIATIALALGLIPVFRALGLPLRFDWPVYFQRYWMSLALQSIFAAALLYVIAFPVGDTLGPLWARCRKQKLLIPLLLAPAILLIAFNGFWVGLVAAIDGIVLIEWFTRVSSRVPAARITSSIAAVAFPALYFFAGFVLVLAYNDVVAAMRFDGSYDDILNRWDSRLMLGTTVPALAHWALSHLPASAPKWLEWIYVLTFPQIGAAMIILALQSGQQRAFRLVATILTAYYIALILFFAVPATGPYYTCLTHFSLFPSSPWFYNGQRPLLDTFRTQHRPGMVRLDYFIAFPCMHLAQPIIVLRYLRQWKRMVAVLVAFDLVLIAAILILEQHYVVDLLGGVAVALLALLMVGDRPAWQAGQNQPTKVPSNGHPQP